jgi:hypothetical protein
VYQPGSTPGRRRKTGPARVLRRSAEGELVVSKPPPRSALPVIEYDRLDEDVIEEPLEANEDAGGEARREGEPRPTRPIVPRPKDVDLGDDANGAVVRQALVELLRHEHGNHAAREINSKYRTGGKASATTGHGARVEISAERFFSFVDRYRSALDACELAIASCPGLIEEKAELIGMIKRMQGSFTTFNLLFADRGDYFSGKE